MFCCVSVAIFHVIFIFFFAQKVFLWQFLVLAFGHACVRAHRRLVCDQIVRCIVACMYFTLCFCAICVTATIMAVVDVLFFLYHRACCRSCFPFFLTKKRNHLLVVLRIFACSRYSLNNWFFLVLSLQPLLLHFNCSTQNTSKKQNFLRVFFSPILSESREHSDCKEFVVCFSSSLVHV